MTANHRRPAFTLVEMLVALGIIILLAALAVGFLPSINEQTKAARGADQLQGWLLLAKTWAVRDQAVRGVRITFESDRLYPDASATGGNAIVCRTLQYIEQPDDMILIANNATQPVSVDTVPPMPGNSPIYNWVVLPQNVTPPTGSILPGDYFQVKGGLVHEISGPAQAHPTIPNTAYFPLTNAFPEMIGFTTDYRFRRRPRVMVTEKPLQFRDATLAIDGPRSKPQVADLLPTGQTFFDILFYPNGTVGGSGAAAGIDKIILWVRDLDANIAPPNSVANGGPSLITIYTRTGFIAAHKVSSGADAYEYTRDARSSGL